jgi:Beta-lactamase class C and other penicillin binding proteins
MQFKPLFIGCILSLFTTTLSAQDLPPGLDAYINKVLATFEVPGIGLAVVKDGKIVLAKGYGVKKMGTRDAVDAHTLFPIASNSKAFTATALGLLVEEGKIQWDDKVIDHLPGFRMSDPFVTSQMTVSDLLVHRSGLAPYVGDLLQFPPSDYTREQIVQKLRYIPLTTSFRSTYAYDNILYLVAGELIKAVSGMEWEDFIRTRILEKNGMLETISRFSLIKNVTNKAMPHARFDGQVKPIEYFFEHGFGDVTNPAGGIVSNASDMARWLIVQLDSGRTLNGNRLFKPATTNALWKMITPMPVPTVHELLKPAQADFAGYGGGFHISNYRSWKTVSHGGKLDGFVSRVLLVPGMKLGIAILTNQESGSAYYAIINHILDHYMKAPRFDWMQAYKKTETMRFEAIAAREKQSQAARDSLSRPSLPLLRYAGTYTDAWYGDVTITHENNQLIMRFTHTPGLTGRLEHWQYNTFIVRWENRELKADAYVNFSIDQDGKIDRVTMKAVSALTDVSFDFHDLLLLPQR